MANPGGTPENLKPWKKGESGNPGGLSRETARLIRENAEKASRIRSRILDALDGEIDPELTSELLRMLKDSEDRGYGAPKQEQDITHSGNVTFTTIYEAKPD